MQILQVAIIAGFTVSVVPVFVCYILWVLHVRTPPYVGEIYFDLVLISIRSCIPLLVQHDVYVNVSMVPMIYEMGSVTRLTLKFEFM